MQSTRIPMLAALAQAMGHMPASAASVLSAPRVRSDEERRQAERDAHANNANRSGLNRKARRMLLAQAERGGKPAGSKLSRKALRGKL